MRSINPAVPPGPRAVFVDLVEFKKNASVCPFINQLDAFETVFVAFLRAGRATTQGDAIWLHPQREDKPPGQHGQAGHYLGARGDAEGETS